METGTTGPGSFTVESKNCGGRLPCGLCLMTNKPCPYTVQYYGEINWATMQNVIQTAKENGINLQATGVATKGSDI